MNDLDMSLPPEVFLLNTVNQKHNRDFTIEKYSVSARRSGSAKGAESMVTIRPRAGSGIVGSVNYYYNRIELDEFFEGEWLVINKDQFVETDELLNELREQLGVYLRREDIVSDVIDQTQRSTKLRISGQCLTYTGYIPVYISGSPEELKARVLKTILSNYI